MSGDNSFARELYHLSGITENATSGLPGKRNIERKRGLEMRPHTTHFDDCGCLSEKYQAEVERLKGTLIVTNDGLNDMSKKYDDQRKQIESYQAEVTRLRDALQAILYLSKKLKQGRNALRIRELAEQEIGG